MRWTEVDFEKLSWHDNHVHAVQVEADNPECGTGVLRLDLDHILEWLRPPVPGEAFRFRVVPATLTFFEVSVLRIEIDWAAATAGIAPFSLDGISRQKLDYPNGYASWAWTLGVNWPTGAITFESPRFIQSARGSVVETTNPCLSPGARTAV
jgi:hypothetical protein